MSFLLLTLNFSSVQGPDCSYALKPEQIQTSVVFAQFLGLDTDTHLIAEVYMFINLFKRLQINSSLLQKALLQ